MDGIGRTSIMYPLSNFAGASFPEWNPSNPAVEPSNGRRSAEESEMNLLPMIIRRILYGMLALAVAACGHSPMESFKVGNPPELSPGDMVSCAGGTTANLEHMLAAGGCDFVDLETGGVTRDTFMDRSRSVAGDSTVALAGTLPAALVNAGGGIVSSHIKGGAERDAARSLARGGVQAARIASQNNAEAIIKGSQIAADAAVASAEAIAGGGGDINFVNNNVVDAAAVSSAINASALTVKETGSCAICASDE